MSEDEPCIEASTTSRAGESLSCVLCRSRKLKCDRTKPRCNRCKKASAECAYPESRRKPAFKRRIVKELEARLVQVEVLLKEAAENRAQHKEPVNSLPAETLPAEDVMNQGVDFADHDISFDHGDQFSFPRDPATTFPASNFGTQPQNDAPPFMDLMDLGGLHESLPPFEMMEALNGIFFTRHHNLIPAIHPARYLQAFYSAPHMRPPMSLQYAIWALAAYGDPKYGHYHEVFYRRARQYADSDEMKGHGEHFITIAHAQAWSLIASYEAKVMTFTRASMSGARAVRLVEMMGLHRLDDATDEISPTLLPPRDWTELEERRRVFWGVFCIDSHCSISTGWPFLIDASEVTTLLPAPEEAFRNGEEVKTCSLHDAVKGYPYSSFAGTILACHFFNQILKHVHRPKPGDHPEDYEHGEYWKRHREIDNTISSAFMYLPSSFRMPDNYRDPVAIHANINFHAATICLHHSALDKIDTYKLPESVQKTSRDRLTTAAHEITNIIKLTSHTKTTPQRSPLAALSLYCAASVYIYLCKEPPPSPTPTPAYTANLDFIIAAMSALGQTHPITKAFLRQVVADIEQSGIRIRAVGMPHLDGLGDRFRDTISHNIPLLARSRISRHTQVQPPLPGRQLPLGRPVGPVFDAELAGGRGVVASSVAGCRKRRRTCPPSEASAARDGSPEGTHAAASCIATPSSPADTIPARGPRARDAASACRASPTPAAIGSSNNNNNNNTRPSRFQTTHCDPGGRTTPTSKSAFHSPWDTNTAYANTPLESDISNPYAENSGANGDVDADIPWVLTGNVGSGDTGELGMDWEALAASLGDGFFR